MTSHSALIWRKNTGRLKGEFLPARGWITSKTLQKGRFVFSVILAFCSTLPTCLPGSQLSCVNTCCPSLLLQVLRFFLFGSRQNQTLICSVLPCLKKETGSPIMLLFFLIIISENGFFMAAEALGTPGAFASATVFRFFSAGSSSNSYLATVCMVDSDCLL